jgi:aspartate/methionine/tyrosine aminotransferase
VPASIFSRLRDHLAKFGGDVIPLQIGDTHLTPPARLDEVAWRDMAHVDLYAYGTPQGWAPLVDALADKVQRQNRIPATAACIQIAVGATHALTCAVQTLIDPGDELILLTPHWPLIHGEALALNIAPVEVPLDDTGALAAAITPKTAGIYLCTPNNPDGSMLGEAQLRAIAALAERHDLWIFADEVYEDYGYDASHVSIASLGCAERCVTVFSFAKSYAQAGLRVGYLVASEPVTTATKKLVNHSVYNVPVAMQRGALGALRAGGSWLAEAKARYLAARDRARAGLHAPAANPPGGAYLWVDFRRWTGDDCMPILEAIAEAGVLLAPGSAFGAACGGFARLCFTGVDEERLDVGIDRINGVLDAR